jgi:two-component system osmolarity sensor histidine kinase EnvZ
MKPRFNTLYLRTAAGLFLGALAIGSMLMLIGWLLMGRPLVQHSATDLAKLIHNAAATYQAMPESRRRAFRQRLWQVHAVSLEAISEKPAAPLVGDKPRLPYLRYLEDALSQLVGKPVAVVRQGETYAVDIPLPTPLRFRFNHDRIGTAPGLALAVMTSLALLASLLAALLLAKRMARPIELIAHRTETPGSGDLPALLPEEGPNELRDIARNFNHMTSQNRELLDNRAAMLAGISHDLRAPITRARMALELARDNMDESLALRIERALIQMDTLIAQYLDFSANGVKEGASPLNIAALLKEVAQTFKNSNIRFEIAEGIVYLPSRAFTRCAQNLLDNAIRHGPAGTPVEASFYKSGSTWLLDVADRGAGIPDDKLDQVFQPFVRLDNARTQPGSGLGLAIVQEICRVQGWFVTLLPRPGGGLIARLSLPLAAQD